MQYVVVVNTPTLYSLYIIEGTILLSCLYARHMQGKQTNAAKETIQESERESNAQLEEIRKSVFREDLEDKQDVTDVPDFAVAAATMR